MTYYVKMLSTATVDNPNFAGTYVWWMGKGGYSRGNYHWLPQGGWSNIRYAEQYIKRKQAYSEELKKHGGEFWTYQYEIVEIPECKPGRPVDEITYKDIRPVMEQFFAEYEPLRLSFDPEAQGKFYFKWIDFARCCQELSQVKSDNWEVRVAVKDAQEILYWFPYGWKKYISADN